MTSPFNVDLELPGPDFRFYERPLAAGMRASTAAQCPACAIIEALDPNDERIFDSFPKGVATLGHMLHQLWTWQAFTSHGIGNVLEQAVPWRHGMSHEDTVVREGVWAGQYEVKTHSDLESKRPDASNVRQTQLRMRLRERAGMEIHGPTRLVMIGKAGRQGARVGDEHVVTLTDERRAEIDETLDGIDAVMARAATLDLGIDPEEGVLVDEDLRTLANGCTRCCPKTKVIAEPDVEELLALAANAKAWLDQCEHHRKAAAQAKSEAKRAYDEVRAELAPLVPAGKTLVGATTPATATKRRDGALLLNTGGHLA